MRRRPLFWLFLSMVFFAAAAWFWRLGDEWAAKSKAARPAPETNQPAIDPKKAASQSEPADASVRLLTQPTERSFAELTAAARERKNRSRFPNRLTNTTRSLNELKGRDTAILLQNAFYDTEAPVSVAIPGNLKATEDPGSYIVQSKGPITDAFRARLKQAGAEIVSYIPNNAYLIRATESVAQGLDAQAVLPYEPYYKLTPGLLDLAVRQRELPENSALNVLLFADAREATVGELKDLGAEVLAQGTSPFGPVVTVRPGSAGVSPAAVANLKGVQEVELVRARYSANDLSRAALGVSFDSQVATNYLGLTGNGVVVNVNDTGVDATHPDLVALGDVASSLVDSNGHGTHVAGIIASTGGKSTTVTNAQGSVMPPTNGQFRGKAPSAKIFSMSYLDSDSYLQQIAARTNVFISNNSWNNGGAVYDLSAASYDAAVRDALPGVPGSRPLLYVFSAGNGGQMNSWDDGSNDDGTGGSPDSILSPGTAKNVITVGALEQPRGITNGVVLCAPNGTNGQSCQTNKEWLPSTDSDDQVASFSSRGNVGIGLEGPFGRFKPDVVAPGSAVVSTRSGQWDQSAYYNPTSHVGPPILFDVQLETNSLFIDSFFIPANAVHVTIDVVGQSPVVPIPIFIRQASAPTTNTYDFVRTNDVSIPPDTALSPNTGWFYGLGNPSHGTVVCDVSIDITVTNEHGDFLQVLKSMNDNDTGQFYRYESGTSMAAADVSGALALMQEFFEQRLGVTKSPALMKALLINGARSIGSYNLQVQNSINFQGWGIVNLTNTIQQQLAAQPSPPPSAGKYYFDQNVSQALATGDSRTYNIHINADSGAQDLPLRITLAWTDPPGNPIASLKLVNDLDLIVTNLDNPDLTQQDIFFGNDIQSGNDFNLPWDTNSLPNVDYVNNVENVYLLPPLGTNYSITVRGKRVNVNAVTAHPNNVVQDYALVISSGDGETNSALQLLTSAPGPASPTPPTIITNDFAESPVDFGQILYLQQAGANTPLLGTNTVTTIPLLKQAQDELYDGRITVGMTNQWHFYIFTNTGGGDFTNVAFVVVNEDTVSVPRMGVFAGFPANATRIYPDIDLYVSQDPRLLNLDPAAIITADKSLSRGGDEGIIYTNSVQGTIYYVGVKAESQEAVEYTFFGDSSPIPFGSTDEQGNFHGYGHRRFAPIPDDNAQGVDVFVLAFGRALPRLTKSAVATNTISHELMGDLVGTLTHRGTADFAVLNNHSPDTPVVNQTFLYDDTGKVPGSRRTDGPGSLLNFRGKKASGVWNLKEVDNALGHLGTNNQFGLFLENQQDLEDGATFHLVAGQCDDAFFTVPPEATNMTLNVLLTNGAGPLFVEICTFDAPQCAAGCKSTLMSPPGGSLSIGINDDPPLNAGTYIVTFCNLGPDTIDFFAQVTNQLGPSLDGTGIKFAVNGPVPILDDAVTTSIRHINTTNTACIRTLEVGVRIDHPRVSDLVLHLISPDGTRFLLSENRGGLSGEGMGNNIFATNIIPVSSSGGPDASTNVVDTGMVSGTMQISYDFFQIPDDMRVYYGTNLIFDTGLVSGSSTVNVDYGPTNGQTTTIITIIMNQDGNPDQNTAWDYTLISSIAQYTYVTFTENTNETATPIKFAVAPFTNANYIGTNVLLTNQIFYFPEDSLGLDVFSGLSPNGDWKLEVWDNRVGATNPQPMLVSWQLSFQYQNVTPPPLSLTDNNSVTNIVGPNKIVYFAVQVPTWASFATNWLVSASGNVNVLFNQNQLPSGTNGPGDFTLLANTTSGTSVLGLTGLPPLLVPGQTYFIGIQNTTPLPVTFVFQVNFDVTPLTLNVPISSTMASNSVPRYFSYDVTTNESGIWFQLTNLTGNVNLVASQTPFPDLATFSYGSFNSGTNNESIIVFTNSDPIPLTPGHWYLGVFNQDPTNVNYTIVVTDFTNAVPPIITLQNMVPYTNTNFATNNIDYYRYLVSSNAVRAQFEVDNPSGDVTLVARKGLPLPDLSNYSYISSNPGTNNELIVLYNTSSPVPLSPGEWFLSVINVSGVPVDYTIIASDWSATAQPLRIISEEIVGGTFCLTWNSLPGVHYFVEGRASLVGGGWTVVSPTVTATDVTTTWCLPLPSAFQYFRVREGFAP